MFLVKRGPVSDTLRNLQTRLQEMGTDYVFIVGMALNVSNYARHTVRAEVLLAPDGFAAFTRRGAESGYQCTDRAPRRFVDGDAEGCIDIFITVALVGRTSKNRPVRFPHPSEAEIRGDLRTVFLAHLIELKRVTWRFKGWGHVVELIRRNNLNESFAERLDPAVRTPYGKCFDQASDEEYDGPRSWCEPPCSWTR